MSHKQRHKLSSWPPSIVLVSHDMNLVKAFCEKTLYVKEGKPKAFGPSDEAAARYVEDMKSLGGGA